MKRGFSLLEILIAAALLGFMGVILMSALTSSLNVRDKAEAISNRHHLLQQALARLSSELKMAYVSNNRNLNNLVVDTQFRGEKDRVSFVAFGGFQHRKNAKESGSREISYFIKDGNLMRREKENPGNPIFKEGEAQLVCPKIDKLELKYFDSSNNSWNSQWKTESKPMAEVTLPARVSIILSTKLNDEEEKISTETVIWLTKPIFLVPS